ncbi:tripartite tricarboxylate transporter TctB family protein [Marinobacterium rhizophilum]|uniref:Tripartite tricarboxylate transporter TctB family protein n=1 Tax=Marinobacterium rhizophilum TaxID=420402 RepID=A0ABY5HHS0_9GAMM|nr:tripartite tricarboxylate transporter TctB family protein [Marinobacterium rhizophilum]UTW11396.1 tripartite tricarboxylate transporter TctB family protein [Marinobacterium rhizophilum]
MKIISDVIGSDRTFSILLIGACAVLYGMIGGLEEPGSPAELAASTYPRILLVCVMLFSAALILKPNRAAHKQAHFPLIGVSVVAIIAIYIALLDVVGYFLLTPALLTVLPLLAGFRRYGLVLLSVVLVTAALYGIFKLVLNIPLPTGFLGG